MSIVSPQEVCLTASALVACLILGSLHVRVSLWLLGFESTLIALATGLFFLHTNERNLGTLAVLIFLSKGCFVPIFLAWLTEKLQAKRDSSCFLPVPLSMLLCIFLFALSFQLTRQLPQHHGAEQSFFGAAAGISQVFSGLVMMMTRRLAISQVTGFLIIENGIYTFALTQTRGMPLLVEMGVLLDLLVAIMVTGLLMFKIQQSFEHIDVTQLRDLRD